MEALTGLLQSLGVNSTLFYQLGIFAFSFFFIRYVAFEPYFRAHLVREQKTEGNQDQAEQIYAQTRELETLYQRRARTLSADIKSIYDKARGDANREQDKIISAARDKAKVSIERAREKIQGEFNKAREDLIKEAPAIGEAIRERLVGKELQ